MRPTRSTAVLVAALALLAVKFVLDRATGESTALVGLYAIPPLLAALATSARATAVVAALAVLLGLVSTLWSGDPDAQALIRLATVVVVALVAVWTAWLRERTERAARRERHLTDRYETLLLALSEVGEGMVVLEQGRCVYANHAFERLSGYGFGELAAMDSVYDLVVQEHRSDAVERAQRRMDDGNVDPEYQLTIRARDGRRVELELAGVPLRLDDRDQLVVVVRDVTARRTAEREREQGLQAELAARAESEWARRQADFLAEASALLDQSLDESRTAEQVAQLAVRDFADTAVVLVSGSPAAVGQVATAAREPRRLALLDELLARYPPQARTGHPLAEVLVSGRSRVVNQPLELLERAGLPPEHFALLRDLGIRSSILIPLRARGRTLGVMGVGFQALRAGAEGDLLALFEDLGRRAALAVDNARLYAERAAVARTLQRSLLPPALPAVEGLELAGRYLAAGEGDEVGGDFYDCFEISDGEWALVIGDVCGKGAEAATVTALARYTIRAAVLHSRRPADVLAELNEAILRQGLEYRFCTALYVALTPWAGGVHVSVASGGHPLPLLLRTDGEVEMVGRPGTLLGIVPEPRIEAVDAELGPGDALVLYTDGVIEASPADDALGPDRLATLVGAWAGRPADGLAGGIADAALHVQDGALRDDVAVVVVRADPGTASFVPSGAGVADAQ